MVLVLVWGKEVVELYVELRYLQDTVIYIDYTVREQHLACTTACRNIVNSYDNTYMFILMREGCTANTLEH